MLFSYSCLLTIFFHRIKNNELLSVSEFDDLMFSMNLQVSSKIFINSAEESLYFDQIPAAQSQMASVVNVKVSMQQTKVDESVYNLSVQQRKCILKDEVKLQHFPNEPYSFSNCMRDCRMQRALELCECLPPFYRSSSLRNSTYCNTESLKCLKDEKILDVLKCQHCELTCDFTTFSVESVQTM